jgi:hypothetical protein
MNIPALEVGVSLVARLLASLISDCLVFAHKISPSYSIIQQQPFTNL